jgi:hypothetical protein
VTPSVPKTRRCHVVVVTPLTVAAVRQLVSEALAGNVAATPSIVQAPPRDRMRSGAAVVGWNPDIRSTRTVRVGLVAPSEELRK